MKIKILISFLTFIIVNCNNDTNWIDQNYKNAVLKFEKGDLENSKKEFMKNYDDYEDYHVVNFYLGKIHFYQGNFEKALEYFLLLGKDKNYNIISNQWIIKTEYVLNKDKTKLLEKINDQNELFSDNIEILLIQAKILTEIGKLEEAINIYNKITTNGYLIAIAHNDLSNIYKDAKLEERMTFHSEISKILSKKYNLNKPKVKKNEKSTRKN